VAVCCEPFLLLVPLPSLSGPLAEAGVEASEGSMSLRNSDAAKRPALCSPLLSSAGKRRSRLYYIISI
jgi:hypothetical protein